MDARASEKLPDDWDQRPTAALLKLAWPITVSMLSISVMTLMDTVFVGRLGPSSLAGVGLGGTAVFLTLCFPLGVLTGAKVLVSQAVGAGRRSEVHTLLAAALFWAVTIGVAIILLGVVGTRWLPLLTSTPESGAAAYRYTTIRLWVTPVMLMGVAIREVRYGLGDARAPMVAAIVANGLNIGLDYVLIFPAGLGVAGAAFATVIAQSAEALILFGVQARDGLRKWWPSRRRIAEVWRMGLPGGLQWLLEMGAFATLAVMISMLSEVEMAGHQITLQVIHFSFLPAVAIAEAGSVLCGQAVGAGRRELVRVIARRAFAVAGSYMAMFSALLLVGGGWIARAFTDDPMVEAAVLRLFMVAAVFQVFDAANMAARGALRGTGDVRFPALIGALLSWGLTPPLMWLLGYRMGLGAAGGWIGLCFEIVLGAGIFWWRLEKDGWTKASDAVRVLAVGRA
jgi:MATE family, multidrug efflux pump